VPQFFPVFVCIFLGGETTKNIRKEMKTDFFSILKQNPRHFSFKKIIKKETLNLARKAVLQLSCNRKEGKI